jgi:zinc protease
VVALISTGTLRAEAPDEWQFEQGTLENGLRVLTLEDRRSPLVSVQVWYHVGSKNENPERQGFAHMFEHMMFRGTDRIGPQDHFRFLSRFGARVNGYTNFDQTVYYETLPASQVDLALWLEAERMGRLKINEDYFAAEREVVKEERRKNYLNRPFGKLYETLYAAAYKVHPYRWTPIGNMPHLDAATVDELKQFFQTYYVPNNATLVLVGDIDHETAMAKARQYFGSIPRRPDPPRVTAVEPPMAEARAVEITDRAPSPLVLFAFHGPGDNDPDALALDLLARILSNGQSSRLYRHLVQGKELAVNVNCYNSSKEQAGLFVLSAVLKPEVQLDAGREALLDEIELLLEKGIEPGELEKARNQVLAAYVRAAETVQGRADQLGYAAVILKDPNRVNSDRQRVRALTADQVMTVAKRVLRESNCVAITVRPDPNLAPVAEQAADQSPKTEEKVVDRPPPAEMPFGKRPEPATLPPPTLRKLANGLRVAVFADEAAPSVYVSLNTTAGARNDPPDMAGLAYCTFNTLRRGTTDRSGDEIAELLDARAISLSAGVGHEDSTVRLWTLSEHLELGTQILSEVVRTPTFPEKEVISFAGRSAAQQAINERDPGTIAGRAFDRALFGEHYLARPTDGTSASLKRVTREAVANFHKRFIAPDNSTLVFAGNITPEAAFALAEQWFGSWEARAEKGTWPKPPAAQSTRILLVDRPEATQSEIRLGQRVQLTRKDSDYAAARLLSQLFGESFSGRLNRTLRIQKGLTYGARGTFDVNTQEACLRLSTFTRNDRTAAAVQAAIQELAALTDEPVTSEELDSARDTLVGSFQMGLETPGQVADRWWNLVVWGLPENWYADYQKSLISTGDPALLRTAAERIDPSRLTVVVVGKAADIKADLEKIAPVEVIREE